MNVSSARSIVPFAFVAAALLATAVTSAGAKAQQITIAEQLYPGAVEGDRGPLLKRLVDDLTGEPLAGAEVFLIAESKTPIGGEFWWTHRGTSDADGFVRIDRPNGDRDWHILAVRHPRCGTATVEKDGEAVVRLGRGLDVPVRIVDWTGRPAPGALVGFCGSCGHGPDLVWANADADGTAVLRGIDVHQNFGDLYVQHPGLGLYYRNIDWRPGDPPFEVRCGYGPVQTGRVLDHTGKPVANAFVGRGNCHRGPWGRTGADGTFTILGGSANDWPDCVVLPGGRSIYFPRKGGVGVTLRLPDLADPKAYQGPAEVDPASAPPPPAIRRIQVVVDDAPAAVRELRAWWPGRPEDLRDEIDEGLAVPDGVPFQLTVAVGENKERQFRDVFVEAAPAGDAPLRVRWLPDPCVTGQCVDASGRGCAARVRWWGDAGNGVATDDDGHFELAASQEFVAEDWRVLELRASAHAVWILRHVRIGGPGSPPVAIGRIDVATPPLRVVAASGPLPPLTRVGFARAGWFRPGRLGVAPDVAPLTADGGWFGGELRTGDTVVVERDGHLPFRTVLAGAGPWRIEVPEAAIELDVVGADAQPLTATVVLADVDASVRDGRCSLHGLRPGRHRLYVSAPGHRSAIVDAEAVVGAPTTIRVPLVPR
jgi:hypothetical protein